VLSYRGIGMQVPKTPALSSLHAEAGLGQLLPEHSVSKCSQYWPLAQDLLSAPPQVRDSSKHCAFAPKAVVGGEGYAQAVPDGQSWDLPWHVAPEQQGVPQTSAQPTVT
jgi:hypothetical protein